MIQPREEIREFWCLWSEEEQGWWGVVPGFPPMGPFGSITPAANHVRKFLNRGECEFDLESETGEMYHFVADSEFWGLWHDHRQPWEDGRIVPNPNRYNWQAK